MPFVVGLLAMVLVAGMMRHLLGTSGVTSWAAGRLPDSGSGRS